MEGTLHYVEHSLHEKDDERREVFSEQPKASKGAKVLCTFVDLLSLYTGRLGNSDLLQTGGMQQFLNKHTPDKQMEPDTSTGCESLFHILPVDCKLKIFSYLSAADLCSAAEVCEDWNVLASDQILWRHKLNRDQWKWNEISNDSYPDNYIEVASDKSYKEIYLQCAPEMCEETSIMRLPQVLSWSSVYHKLNFFRRKAPRIALFGPGLESSTSKIVRNVIYQDSKTFKKKKMFPGMSGVGSGFTIGVNGSQDMDLITLYSNTYEIRRLQNQGQQNNRLFQNNVDGSVEVELQPIVRELCRTIQAFVLCVDATASIEKVRDAGAELRAMLTPRWSDTTVPVLVLACTPNDTASGLDCLSLVRALRLGELNRPWKVKQCCVENLSTIAKCFQWIISSATN